MRWLQRRRTPQAPQGVEVVYRNGERIPCEIYYVGIVDGTHTWEVTAAFDAEQIECLHVAVLPAKTSVRLYIIQ